MSDATVKAGDLFIHEYADGGLMVYDGGGFSEFRMKQGYVFTVLELDVSDGFPWKYLKVLMANTGKVHYVLQRDFDGWLSRGYLKRLG